MSRNLKKYMMEPEAMQYKKGGFIPAEVEGGEKLVADNGVVVKHFKGKSHAKGGIKTMLPVGHYVISKHDLDGDGHSDAKVWDYKTDMERRAYLKALDERPDGERKVDVKGILRRRFLSGGDVTLGDVNTKAKHARNLKIASGVLGTAASVASAFGPIGMIVGAALGVASAGTGIAGTVMSNKANEAGLTLEEQEKKREEELRKKNIDESNTIRQQVNQNPYLVSKYGSSTNNYFKRYAFGKSPYDTGAESPISGNGADGNFMQKFGDFAGGYGNVISTGISAAGQIGGSIANSVFANRAAEEQALKDAQTHNDRMAAIDKNTKYANYMKNNINTNPFVLREDGGKINSKDISYFQNGDPTGKKIDINSMTPYERVNYLRNKNEIITKTKKENFWGGEKQRERVLNERLLEYDSNYIRKKQELEEYKNRDMSLNPLDIINKENSELIKFRNYPPTPENVDWNSFYKPDPNLISEFKQKPTPQTVQKPQTVTVQKTIPKETTSQTVQKPTPQTVSKFVDKPIESNNNYLNQTGIGEVDARRKFFERYNQYNFDREFGGTTNKYSNGGDIPIDYNANRRNKTETVSKYPDYTVLNLDRYRNSTPPSAELPPLPTQHFLQPDYTGNFGESKSYGAPNAPYYKASEMKPSAEPSPVNTTLGINSDRLRKNIMDRYLNTQTIGSLGREVSGLIQAFEPNTPQYQPPVPVQPHMQQDFTEANRANAIRDIMRGYRTSNAMSTPTIDRQQANAEQLQKFDSLLGAQQQINNQALQTKQAIQGANTEQINRYLDTINAQNREASMLNWNRGVAGDNARMDAVQRTLEAAQQQRGDIEANRTQAYLNLVDAPEKRAIDDIETEMRMVQVNPDLTPEVKEMKYRELLERKNQLLSGRFNNNNLFKRYYGQGI